MNSNKNLVKFEIFFNIKRNISNEKEFIFVLKCFSLSWNLGCDSICFRLFGIVFHMFRPRYENEFLSLAVLIGEINFKLMLAPSICSCCCTFEFWVLVFDGRWYYNISYASCRAVNVCRGMLLCAN